MGFGEVGADAYEEACEEVVERGEEDKEDADAALLWRCGVSQGLSGTESNVSGVCPPCVGTKNKNISPAFSLRLGPI